MTYICIHRYILILPEDFTINFKSQVSAKPANPANRAITGDNDTKLSISSAIVFCYDDLQISASATRSGRCRWRASQLPSRYNFILKYNIESVSFRFVCLFLFAAVCGCGMRDSLVRGAAQGVLYMLSVR